MTITRFTAPRANSLLPLTTVREEPSVVITVPVPTAPMASATVAGDALEEVLKVSAPAVGDTTLVGAIRKGTHAASSASAAAAMLLVLEQANMVLSSAEGMASLSITSMGSTASLVDDKGVDWLESTGATACTDTLGSSALLVRCVRAADAFVAAMREFS